MFEFMFPYVAQIESKKEFREERMKLSIFSLKTEILLKILRMGSNLFHSMIADEKRNI